MASTLKHKMEDKIHQATSHKSPEGYHLAAIQKESQGRLVFEEKSTPKPGQGQVLVDVHTVALNPVDWFMRDMSGFIKQWPALFGNDIAGSIVEIGPGVEGDFAKIGTRVAALAPVFYTGDNNMGGFQAKVVVPTEYLILLPEWCSDVEGAKLPLGVATAWHGWSILGLPYDKTYGPADKKAVLIWGGSSSVGSSAVQIANILGYTVFTTASVSNHPLLKALGAKHVFDYKKESVVNEIVAAFKAEDVELTFIYDAAGASKQCNQVAKALNPTSTTLLAYAPPVLPDTERVEGVDLRFVLPPDDATARSKWFVYIFNDWLTTVLAKGTFKPSPNAKLVTGSAKGLELLNDGLDELKSGVSGTKLVIEL